MLTPVRFGTFTKVVCPDSRPSLFSQQEDPKVAKAFENYFETTPDLHKRLVVIGPNERLLITGEEDLARFQKTVDKLTTKPAKTEKEAEAPKPAQTAVLTGWGSFVKSVRETAQAVTGQFGEYFDFDKLSRIPTEAEVAAEYARTAALEGSYVELYPFNNTLVEFIDRKPRIGE